MRRLADQCFMLRDWKLALSTYDILRTDFSNDKAWRHYAGAAEMGALSALLMTGPASSKTRIENIDSWIEAASYSYTDRQRSAAPYYALRTLALSLELLRLRGASAADDAARWASRILEMGLVGTIGNALFTERVSACYSARVGLGAFNIGSRRRKAAFWSVMAAECWLNMGKTLQAEKCIEAALRLYQVRNESGSTITKIPFAQMQSFIDSLRQQILGQRLSMQGLDQEEQIPDVEQSLMVEQTETEALDISPRPHRHSLIGGGSAPPIDVGPRSPALDRHEEKKDDLFE
jgi:tetratricopeptide (TPR) repeat protein